VRNPFRSEEEAFRFVWLTILYAALIVAASFINVWVGLAVFLVETALILWWIFRRGRRESPIPQAPPPHPEGERRILVIANETVGGEALLDEIRRHSEGVAEHVLVVVPALNSPLRHWTSDEDGARLAAQKRLEDSLASLRASGVDASGEIGDSDPLQAIEDAIRTFAPDELIISTHPPERSHWLERGVVAGARERFALPVTHVVTDLGMPTVGSEPPGLKK
jgi:GABA permease